jgi:hypothetical protein
MIIIKWFNLFINNIYKFNIPPQLFKVRIEKYENILLLINVFNYDYIMIIEID